jgi:hypothetical protein
MELHSMPAGQDHHTDYRISRDQSAGMAGIIQPITGPKVGFGSTTAVISTRALGLLHPNQQTLFQADRLAREVPGGDIGSRASPGLFDRLVDAHQQGERHLDAERLRGLQVDNEVNVDRLLDGQVGRFITLENAAGIDTARR